MPTELVWRDERPEGPFEPGLAFPSVHEQWLSGHFLKHVAGTRPAIDVTIPTRDGGCVWFCVDSHPSDAPDEHWNVTIVGELVDGQRPHITVAPSINIVGLYHGHLKDGVLTDDIGD